MKKMNEERQNRDSETIENLKQEVKDVKEKLAERTKAEEKLIKKVQDFTIFCL